MCLLCRPFFQATVFCKLVQSDPFGRISIMQFFNYVMRKVWLHQTRIGLSLYDVAGLGYLKESVRTWWFHLLFMMTKLRILILVVLVFLTRTISLKLFLLLLTLTLPRDLRFGCGSLKKNEKKFKIQKLWNRSGWAECSLKSVTCKTFFLPISARHLI